MSKLKVEHDKENDLVYVTVRKDTVDRTEEIAPGLFVDLDEDGMILGVEIIGAEAETASWTDTKRGSQST